ncbi:MAG: biopolymer transporter ExbD [Pirellulaceae bacterium]|nr:biopolymer transporter ExbD [Pirellulaceae bacterium]
MRRMSPYLDRRNSSDVTMTPMIDVIFLLLVFFVWTASFQIVEEVLPSSLSAAAGSQADPRQPPPPEEDFDAVLVRIAWDEGRVAWQVNDAPLASLTEVRQRLDAIARLKPDAPVILDPDQTVPLGDVIDVYDHARRAGFQKVQFATSEEV